MPTQPEFASVGQQAGTIDVRLSYKIVELFSEGLYASPHKAIEELTSNSFDAGATTVQVLLSANLQKQDATIVVIDDGEGMDKGGLKEHWLIGLSKKRERAMLPHGRQPIGKFGIGKLATYVLANRLTHISKSNGKYYSTSMDYTSIEKRTNREVEPTTPIKLPLRELKEAEAKQALKQWTDTAAFKKSGMALFGKGSSASWTFVIMSALKKKVHEIKPGVLEWVLRTALPLRPDFAVYLNGVKLVPSKAGKGRLEKWVLGRDLTSLPRPAPKDLEVFEDAEVDSKSEHRYGLEVPGLGRVTGYAEVYRDLLTGKSDATGRSHGFFVYVFGRLVNVFDGHFGISPDELRHGSFGRIRVVVHMDGLDPELRSNREAVSEGPTLTAAQNVLRGIFNAIRPTLEKHDENEEPGAKLARKFAASPASLSTVPIVELAKSVVAGKAKSRFLVVPERKGDKARAEFIESLENRAKEEKFVTGLSIDYSGNASEGLAKFDTATGNLRINAWHPFVAAFHDDFAAKGTGQALELFAMAEVLIEAHLHTIGAKREQIEDFLLVRDQLLRHLANESARQGAFSVAAALREARNDADGLEEKVCAAFTSLGFEVTPIGGPGKPDGVATAILSPDERGNPQQYKVSLEAKSKEQDEGKVAAGTVKTGTVIRHRDEFDCVHAIVVGRDFPTTKGEDCALAKEITDDRNKTASLNNPKTITLITIDDLARLVRLRPRKQLGLRKLRELFQQCRLPEESLAWIEAVERMKVKRPPYKAIINTIERLQKKWTKAAVKYAALRIELSHLDPAIEYEDEEVLRDLCKAMAQMAPEAIYAGAEMVELNQSAANVLAAIEAATKEDEDDGEKPG